ncbi:MAG TPA: CmcI family methyltransferase [Gemmataceae bacterium]|nr:CmcI family methyltransferase [Gemmataceae bacterium]
MFEEQLDAPLREILPAIQRRILSKSRYFGIPTLKHPYDFWVYQEMLNEKQPDVIIEIGNYHGGSTLALAHLCDLLGKGRVIAVDFSHVQIDPQVLRHPRILFVQGDPLQVADIVKAQIQPEEKVIIIEDSTHTYDLTLGILRAYNELIKPGDYFIIEDGICWHGLEEGPKPGPYEAIEDFVRENPAFQIDRSCEDFTITWNPKGYLKRVA